MEIWRNYSQGSNAAYEPEEGQLLPFSEKVWKSGIRFGDILELRTENLQGKELLVIERKYGGVDYYRNPDGSLPVISETTAKLLVPGEDEKFFHHDKRYYVVVLRKAFPSKEFKFHYIRQYVMDMQRLRKM